MRRGVRAGTTVVVMAAMLATAGNLLAPGSALALGVPPTADDQALSTPQLTALPVTLTAHDPEGGGALTFAAALPANGVVLPAAGAMTCVDNGGVSDCTAAVTYTPDMGFHGTDSFTFTATDLEAETSPAATVTIDVNSPPVAGDDGAATNEDTPITSIDVLANDTDPDLDSLSIEGFDPASANGGTVSDNGDGTLAYAPAGDFNGSDTFDYVVTDGVVTDTGTVTITVTAVNDAPSFTPGGGPEVDEDSGAYAAGWATGIGAGPSDESGQAVSFQVTADDNSSLFSVAPAVATDGTLTFTPAANRNGAAHLTIVAVDDGGTANGGQDTSGETALTITVAAVNDPPNAVNDIGLLVPEGSPGTVLDVLANDTSLPDDPEVLVIVAVTQGDHGTVSITDAGATVTYVPDPLFHGTDVFTYTIEDPGGLSDDATVVVDVGEDLTAPTVDAPGQAIRKNVQLGSSTLKARISWGGSDAGVGIARFVVQRSVNGGKYKTITIPRSTATAVSQTLSIGATYRFRVRAVDRNGNASAWAYGPRFKVGRYQETSRAIAYGGKWVRAYAAKHSGGAVRYTRVAGRSATLTRTLRDVAFVAPTSSGRGTADIYVDGVKVASISLKSSRTRYRRVLWTAHFETLASHVIRIEVTGSRRVDVDCFVILR